MRKVVQASGGKERMSLKKFGSAKNSVSAWRTTEVGEKFGINAAAFKARFS